MSAQHWLYAIQAVAFLAAAIAGWLWHGAVSVVQSIYVLAAFPLYILTYGWMKADARERGVPPPAGAIPLIAVLYFAAVPYYLLATRSRGGKLLSMCRLMAFIVLLLLLTVLGEVLTDTSPERPFARFAAALLLAGFILGGSYLVRRTVNAAQTYIGD